MSSSLIISVVVVWYSVSVVSAHSAQKRKWPLVELVVTILREARANLQLLPFHDWLNIGVEPDPFFHQ